MESYQGLVETVRAASGAERDEALGKLIRRFEERAYRWAFAALQDSHWAQDAVQEAFITAYEHLDQLKDPAAFPGWFKQIVLRQCQRMLRGKHFASEGSPVIDDSAIADEPDPSEELEDRESNERVEQALRRLPEHERTVTELFYLSDYSQHEIAERLAVPVTTVKKRLQYARKHLRVEFLKGGQFRSALVNDPLVTWLIAVDDPNPFYPEEDDPAAPAIVRDIVLEAQPVPMPAGSGATEPMPLYGRIAWRAFS